MGRGFREAGAAAPLHMAASSLPRGHLLLREQNFWHLTSCRIVYDSLSVKGSWTGYTDHNPVECVLRVGKWWRSKKGRSLQTNPGPGASARFRSPSKGASGKVTEAGGKSTKGSKTGTIDEAYK